MFPSLSLSYWYKGSAYRLLGYTLRIGTTMHSSTGDAANMTCHVPVNGSESYRSLCRGLTVCDRSEMLEVVAVELEAV